MNEAELAQRLYDNAGPEISQNFETMNATLSLAAGAIAAIVKVLGTGELFENTATTNIPPLSPVALILLVAVLPLIDRFFFRSLLAYKHLMRFNLIQSKMLRYLRGQISRNGAGESVDIYLDQWKSPLPLSKAFVANLKSPSGVCRPGRVGPLGR